MASLRTKASQTLASALRGQAVTAARRRRTMSTTARRAFQVEVPGWASPEARTALEGFAARFGTDPSQPAMVETQHLDQHQAALLRLTLSEMVPLDQEAGAEPKVFAHSPERQYAGLSNRTRLLPTEHLAYFTPRVASWNLGADGSDTSFNPPGGVFTRRMWAGGEMRFQADAPQLLLGERAYEHTFVEDAQLKQLGGGRGEMIVVWVRKEFGRRTKQEEAPLPPSIIDRRSWVFQRALPPSAEQQQQQNQEQEQGLQAPSGAFHPDMPAPVRLVQTPASLFRYSALTFNAHAIHLSPTWARDVEGHRDIVVHGPLTLSLLVRTWGRDHGRWFFLRKRGGSAIEPSSGRRLVSVAYRAKRPLYAGEPYWLGYAREGQDEAAGKHTLVAVKADGQVAMEATVLSAAPSAAAAATTEENSA
ncbi:hypothetical protein FA10DRAFT_268226 [Acaromyces ingoldii]|uniref:Thioesterase/thiol ester dehydrase-isomerase n=1 Tax=Acaromyces ingoldii TaxID=215250 RepID=A0A316YM24_9BASI|nr:hypothetical protein FA10DRAFT_268226 [Acaromyces ingoldii]PWN89708.1 hypothetical protein FA10DRAFT_268226 [Acaromyces ingoldii]